MDIEKPVRILVVDDNGKNLQFVGSLLSENGYDVAFSLNGFDALNSIERVNPDLILLDIMMPGINGYDVCGKIKGDKNIKHIPVIFLTAKAELKDVVAGFGKGAIDYILKPFNSQELLVRVKTHVELKKARERIEKDASEINKLNLLLKRKNLDLSNINRTMENIIKSRTYELKQANKRLNRLNDEKMDFLRYISHEMNTPLNFISAASLLDKENLSEDNIKIIEIIEHGFFRINNFVKAVIDYFQFAGEKLDLKPQEVSIREIVDNVLSGLSRFSGTKDITFATSFEQSFKIMADKEYFQEILTILIHNAITYSNNGDMVHIIVARENDLPVIRITDTGKGIAPGNIEKIFKPYLVQEHDRHESGYGLNLPKAKIIADACGWTLTAESKGTGKGSSFVILLDQE